MTMTTIAYAEAERIARQLFSWQSSDRKSAESAFESADAAEKLKLLEAMLPVVSRDYRAAWYLAWLGVAGLGTTLTALLSQEQGWPIVIWLCALVTSACVHIVSLNQTANRQKGIAAILDRASDYRIVPAALSYRVWLTSRFGANSKPHLSLISALCRLLPEVTFENIGNNQSNWRWALTPFLEGSPLRSKLTIEALRLAPAYGDAATLRSIERLADQHEWGAAVPADQCEALREAAAASAIALREVLVRHNQTATLLRASETTLEPPSTALLRASTGATTDSPNELLRANQLDS